MKTFRVWIVAGALGLACGGVALAQSDTSPGKIATGRRVNGVPSDALGRCKDGAFVSTGMKATACSEHRGTKIWYSDGVPNTSSDGDERKPSGSTATGRNVGGIPSDVLGRCNDGTFVSTGTKADACAAYGGMKIWYSDGVPNT